jgi:outer membrane protein assembly factor BamB
MHVLDDPPRSLGPSDSPSPEWTRRGLSRRQVLGAGGTLLALSLTGLVAACQSAAPSPTAPAAAPTSAPAAAAPTATSPAPTAVPTTAPVATVAPTAVAATTPTTAPTVAAAPTLVPSPSPISAAAPNGQPERAMYQMNPQHTGRSPYAGPSAPTPVRTFDMPSIKPKDPGAPRPDIQSSAAIGADGTIYIGDFYGNLVALQDPGSGDTLTKLWAFHPAAASSWHTTPAIGADGTLYAGFSTGGITPQAAGTFYALKPPATGGSTPDILWTVPLGLGRQTGSPTIAANGDLYVVSGNGKLFAVSSAGDTKWTAQTGPTVKTSPALGPDGTVYVPSMNGKLYAVKPPTSGTVGSIAWTFDFGQHLGAQQLVTAKPPPPGVNGIGSGVSPTIGPDATIYLGADNSNFYALAPDGKLKWQFAAEPEVGGIWSSAALSADNQTLYFGANKGGIYALDTASGTKRWQFPIYGSVYNSPTLDANGVLYTGSTIGDVFALDGASGKLLWAFPAGQAVWTAPAIRADGSMVVGTLMGQVLLLGAK